jgi:hypothetical protein
VPLIKIKCEGDIEIDLLLSTILSLDSPSDILDYNSYENSSKKSLITMQGFQCTKIIEDIARYLNTQQVIDTLDGCEDCGGLIVFRNVVRLLK